MTFLQEQKETQVLEEDVEACEDQIVEILNIARVGEGKVTTPAISSLDPQRELLLKGVSRIGPLLRATGMARENPL